MVPALGDYKRLGVRVVGKVVGLGIRAGVAGLVSLMGAFKEVSSGFGIEVWVGDVIVGVRVESRACCVLLVEHRACFFSWVGGYGSWRGGRHVARSAICFFLCLGGSNALRPDDSVGSCFLLCRFLGWHLQTTNCHPPLRFMWSLDHCWERCCCAVVCSWRLVVHESGGLGLWFNEVGYGDGVAEFVNLDGDVVNQSCQVPGKQRNVLDEDSFLLGMMAEKMVSTERDNLPPLKLRVVFVMVLPAISLEGK
ncbi:hypothetical protein AMTR_s00007p00267340, partial [Amborella trichopoda]